MNYVFEVNECTGCTFLSAKNLHKFTALAWINLKVAFCGENYFVQMCQLMRPKSIYIYMCNFNCAVNKRAQQTSPLTAYIYIYIHSFSLAFKQFWFVESPYSAANIHSVGLASEIKIEVYIAYLQYCIAWFICTCARGVLTKKNQRLFNGSSDKRENLYHDTSS